MTTFDAIGVVPFDARSSKPRFAQTRGHILRQMPQGELPAGRRLPPLRKRAVESDVACETMSRAIRELLAQGVLETCPGRLTRVAAPGKWRWRRPGADGFPPRRAGE